MGKGDEALLSVWAEGVTLDVASERLRTTPTSIASKLVRLGVFKDRVSVNAYVGQSQNFRKRKKSHVRRFSTLLAGQMPLIEEVETVETYALAREAELAIIAKLSNAGYILRNVLDREEGNV